MKDVVTQQKSIGKLFSHMDSYQYQIVPNGKQIKKNFVGKNLANYDSILVFSHFKGHIMGGFGGAMKNTSIGIASRYGKEYIHGAGVPEHKWVCDQDKFLESMADAVKSVM